MSLIAELKRRKVVKVGVAYLVVAWLVIQVGATVAPQLNLPDWAPRLITLLVLLGFPISLVIAWVVDITPEGIKLETAEFGNKRMFTVAAVLAALAIGWFLRGGVEKGSEPFSQREKGSDPFSAAALGERSTAVLPFVNMSADKDNEYFSDGLTETLLHKLAQVAELKVAARTSSFAFKGKNSDVRTIGAELGVATVIEGSVQRAGDTLRITAQLVRTADGSHIWSKSYDRKQADLFAIQDEIAGAVTQALIGALVPEAQAAIAKGGTADLAAYDLYARGLQDLALSTYESLDRAERAMQQAIARDPKYVDALVGLVMVWRSMHWTGKIPTSDFIARAPAWLDRIAALDPDHAMLLGYRAIVANAISGRDEANRLFERGIAAHPGNAELRSLYATYLAFGPDPEGALAQYDVAIELDPLNPEHHLARSYALQRSGRLDDAEVAARRAMALDPANPGPPTALGDIALRRGDMTGHLVGYLLARRIDAHDHELAAGIALGLDGIGEAGAADAWLAESRRLTPNNLDAEATDILIRYARGEHEAALAGALAIAARHGEERRDNWSRATSAGCLAAVELGRAAELRAALERERVVPRELSAEGFQALETPRYSVAHQSGHLAALSPCLFESGDAGAQRRQQALAALATLRRPEWPRDRRFQLADPMLRADRQQIVAVVLPETGEADAVDDLPRRASLWRWWGVGDDPQLVAYRSRIDASLAEARAALPALLEAEGLSLSP